MSDTGKQLIWSGIQFAISVTAIIAIIRSAYFMHRASRNERARRIRKVRSQ